MDKPLLSICIPTYNRYKYLKHSLNSIICQKEFQEKKVEIVISDNASTDDTQKLCKEYSSHFENIHYYRNPENVHDRNFPLALSRGKGIYRKLSNDTILYLPKSLKYMCDLILLYQGTEKPIFWHNGESRIKDRIVECKNFNQFVIEAGAATTATRTFGLWENECKRVTNDFSGCDLKLWQCKRIYEMVNQHGDALIINQKWMHKQDIVGKDVSYGLFQVLYLNFLSILEPYFSKGLITQETYDAVRIGQLYSFAYALVFGDNKLKMSNSENIGELVLKELQEAGCVQDFMKYYKRRRLILPVKTCLKDVYLGAYTAWLSRYVRKIWNNTPEIGDLIK